MIAIASLLMNLALGGTFDVYVAPMSFVDRATNESIIITHESDAPLYYSSLYETSAKRSQECLVWRR